MLVRFEGKHQRGSLSKLKGPELQQEGLSKLYRFQGLRHEL